MTKPQIKCENCNHPCPDSQLRGIEARKMVICVECLENLQLEADHADSRWLMYRLIGYKQRAKAEAGGRSRMWGDTSLR